MCGRGLCCTWGAETGCALGGTLCVSLFWKNSQPFKEWLSLQ